MRITEARMMGLAEQAVATARDRSATTGQVVSSGTRVSLPSQDVAAWSEGLRTTARTIMSTSRGGSIASAKDRLQQTDQAFASMSTIVQRVRDLAVQMGSDTYGASDRVGSAPEVYSLRQTMISLANGKDETGQSLLSGAQGGAAFDANGVYIGDGTSRSIEDGEGLKQSVSVPGSVLTAASGVDVMATIKAVGDALAANDAAAVRASLDAMTQAVSQVALARGDVGTRINALDSADKSRRDFEVNLAATHARAVEADAVSSTADFTLAKNGLDAAQALAQQIVTITRPPA